MSDKRVRIFSTGMEYEDWVDHNCRRCKKFNQDESSKEACEIDYEFGSALLGDGTIDYDIAARSGYPVDDPDFIDYRFVCVERDDK